MIVYGCAFDFFNTRVSICRAGCGTQWLAPARRAVYDQVNGVGGVDWPFLSGMAVDYFSIDGVKDWQTICWSCRLRSWHWPLFCIVL